MMYFYCWRRLDSKIDRGRWIAIIKGCCFVLDIFLTKLLLYQDGRLERIDHMERIVG